MNKMSMSEAGKLGWEKTKHFHLERYKKNLENYNLNPKKCKKCDCIIDYKHRENKFCSHTCASLFINENKDFNNKIECLNCKILTKNRKFCTKKCYFLYNKNCIKNKMNSGDCNSLDHQTIRKYLIKERGNRCESCKLEKWMNKHIPIDIHHIDGIADNNKLENLQLLCKNCHGLTDNYGSKNKNSSRNWRKEYITEQKKQKEIYKNKTKAEIREALMKGGYKNRKVKERPNLETLSKQVEENGFLGTGKIYNVSDNTIRKWIRLYSEALD